MLEVHQRSPFSDFRARSNSKTPRNNWILLVFDLYCQGDFIVLYTKVSSFGGSWKTSKPIHNGYAQEKLKPKLLQNSD